MNRLLRNILAPLSVFLFSVPLIARHDAEPGGFRHITVRDGLPSSEVYRIIQDRHGYLWMCTDAGVCRYNGYSFQSFTTRDGLTDNTIFYLQEDPAGRIWAQGFSGALSWFDGKKFNSIPANDSLKKIYKNGQQIPWFIVADSAGGITLGGLYTFGCYRVGPEDHFSVPHLVKPAEKMENEFRVIWTTPEKKVLAYAGNIYGVESGLVFHNGHKTTLSFGPTIVSPTNNRVLLTHDNRVFYSYSEHLYVIFPDGKMEQHDFPHPIVGLGEDHSGNLWVSMYLGGACLCRNGNFTDTKTYFPGRTVGDVFEDNESGYWFSSVGDGVYFLPDLRFGYLTQSEGLPESNIVSLASYKKNSVLIGMPNGTVVVFNPDAAADGSFELIDSSRHTHLSIDALLAMNSYILMSDDGYRLLDTNFHTVQFLPELGHAKGLTVNPRDSSVMIYSSYDLDWLRPRTFTLDSGIRAPTRFTAACYSRDGTLWLGALDGLWKLENGQPVYLGNSLKDLHVRIDGICEDNDGVLWLASRGEGVFALYNNKTWHFGETEGLSGNTCRAITLDEEGHVWVGTNRGVTMISHFDRSRGTATLRSFNSTHGLLSDEIKCLLCKNGKLWMGSNEGLCWISISALAKNPVAPPVYITRVVYGNDPCRIDTVQEFDFSDKTIRIFIEGLCFRDPSGLRYKYRLLGGDGQWITTANREISFAGLAPGDYRLEVIAVNSDGTESRTPAFFAFHILTPFRKSWWFILFMALLIIGIGWIAASYRLRHLQKRAEEKAETERRIAELRLSALRAQMNPHFIFNAINSIQHFVLQNHSDQAYNYLSKFSRLIRMVLDQSQSETIPLDQELKMLNLYVELEQLRFERPFRFHIHVDPQLEDESIRLPGMLVQPFVENAIWHGLLTKKNGDAWIRISFTKQGSDLEIVIEDNGVGRKQAAREKSKEQRKSYGLQITEERLRLSEVHKPGDPIIEITDLEDAEGNPAGTRVRIRLSNAAVEE